MKLFSAPNENFGTSERCNTVLPSLFCNNWPVLADGGHSEEMKALSIVAVPPTPSDSIGPAERVTAQVCMGNIVTVSFNYLQPGLDHNVQKV